MSQPHQSEVEQSALAKVIPIGIVVPMNLRCTHYYFYGNDLRMHRCAKPLGHRGPCFARECGGYEFTSTTRRIT